MLNIYFLRFTHLFLPLFLDPTLRPCMTLTRVLRSCMDATSGQETMVKKVCEPKKVNI